MKINSVTGSLATASLGKTLMHEHLVIGFTGWDGDTLTRVGRREVVAACVDRIEELKSHGYTSLVDPCPNDLGRDVDVMGEVAARTGFNVIFAVGIYDEKYAGAYWKDKLASDPDAASYLTEMYVREIEDGVGDTGARPAVIKVACGPGPFPKHELIAMEAAAKAASQTGTPILTHTEGVDGDHQLRFLTSHGVEAKRVIVGHCCGNSDHAYHKRICEDGAYIGFDRFGLEKVHPDEARIAALVKLLEAGYLRSSIISHDCVFHLRGQMGTKERVAAAHARSPLHFERSIAPRLREAGVSQDDIDTMLTVNPRSYFEGVSPA